MKLNESRTTGLYIALIHYPVTNKNGDVITSAVTNLDLHDIARAARTYGVERFYVVTPLTDQQELVRKILAHWLDGGGAEYNPDRGMALQLIRVMESLDQVVADIKNNGHETLKTVATCARKISGSIPHGALRRMLAENIPSLLMFGTAWGLEKQFIDMADYVLDPIAGFEDYNHLSVRSAASILMDRLLGHAID